MGEFSLASNRHRMISPPSYRLKLPTAIAATVRKSNAHFLITGARGWLGRATVELLESALGADLAARVTALGSSSGNIMTRGGSVVQVHALESASRLDLSDHVLMHYAYLTKDRLVSGVPLDDYRRQNAAIRQTVLQWLELFHIKRMFLPSAGAVYSAMGTLGDVDSRADYGRDKLADEGCFDAACDRLGGRLLIGRIFSVSGPHINKHEAYALAAIILALLNREPVILRARRPVYRSYVGVGDLIAVALGWLLASERPERLRVDIASAEIVEIGELASRAAAVLGVPDAKIERPPVMGDADRYVGDAAALQRLAGSLGVHLANLDQQIKETAAYLTAGGKSKSPGPTIAT